MNPVYYQLKLDRDIPVPLYYQLKQFMITNIENGKLKEGDAVPTEEADADATETPAAEEEAAE